MSQIQGPVLALGIDARPAKKGADEFSQAINQITGATTRAEGAYRSSGTALSQMGNQMPTTSGKVRELTASVGGLGTAMGTVTSKAHGLAAANAELSKTAGLMKGLGQGLIQGAGFAATNMLFQLPRQFVEISASAERMQRALTVATGSAGGATSTLSKLYDISSRLGAPIEGLTQLYAGIARSSGELGASQSDMLKVVEGVSAALSLSGQSAASASGSMIQMAQAFASGTVRAEEFNSMIEGQPALMMAAAKHIDGTNGSLSDMRRLVLEGKLSSQEFFKAVVAGSEDVSKQAKDMGQSWDGAMMSMVNGGTRLITTMNEATGVTKALKGVFESLGQVAEGAANQIAAAMGRIDAQVEAQKAKLATLQRMADHPGLGGVAKELLPGAQAKLDKLEKEQEGINGLLNPGDALKKKFNRQVDYGTPFGPSKPEATKGGSSGGGGSSKADTGERDFANFKENVARDYFKSTHDEIAQIEQEKKHLLDELSKLKASPTEKAAVAGQIEDIAKRQIAEVKTEQLKAVQDVVSRSEIMVLESEARLAASTEERLTIQLKLIEKRGEAEIRQLQEVLDKTNADVETKKRLLADKQKEIGNEQKGARLDAVRDRFAEMATKTKDEVGMMESAFKDMGSAASSAFEDAVASGSKLSDVVLGLGKDIEKALIKNLISKPLGKLMDQGTDYLGSMAKDWLSDKPTMGGYELSGDTAGGGGWANDMWNWVTGAEDNTAKMSEGLDKQFEASLKLTDSASALGDSGAAAALTNAGGSLASVAGSLGSALGSALGGGQAGQAIGGIAGIAMQAGMMALMAAKDGAVVDRGYSQAFAGGGIFDRPTTFPMANGRRGLLGEAGPEAILPLARGADGSLGVRSGGSSKPPVVNVFNQNGSKVEVQEDPADPNAMNIVIDNVEKEIARRNARPGTMMNKSTRHVINPVKRR
ncbi:hypothetical protein DF3PB_600010 [uncultured Defluviicoccus sp.]|uniref:Tape measure protein N-terminal domain-containing protein n=1 Tax=metagenome TaxID=256318 RepID=A0A380TIS9_9ZZZZ|nr:hypothetical protein DF3PB_600010 [uncultured Defluviicoccus sp.]